MFDVCILESIADSLHEHPKVQLSEECPCSPEVREEFNKWLLEMFGTEYHSYFLPQLGDMFLGPKAFAMLRTAVKFS